MSYLELIREIGTDAEKLETSYRTVVAEGDEQAFVAAIDDAYTDDPDNLLYAAWHYRLAHSLADRLDEWRIDWAWAIPLAIVNGLLLWWLSDDARFSVQIMGVGNEQSYNSIPHVLLLWAPISAAAVLTYLAWPDGVDGRFWSVLSASWRCSRPTCSSSSRRLARPSFRNST